MVVRSGRPGLVRDKDLVAALLQGREAASAEVITVWIVLAADDKPRLMSVYPL